MLRFKRLSVFVAALLLASSALASNDAVSSINELPAIEIPAKAAELVRAAPADQQLNLSRSLLTTVLKERPQMAVQMVATLCKAAPDSAPVLAVIAASIVPQYGDVILRAAAASAPDKAEVIAATSGIFFPESQDLVIKAVSSAVPAQAESIAAMVESLPQRFAASPVGGHNAGGGVAVSIGTVKKAISQVAPVTTIVNPITKEVQNLSPSGLEQVIQQVEEVNAKAAAGDTTVEAISAVEVINLTILKAVVEIQQDAPPADEEEGFASVAEVEVFVEGDVAVDSEAREDPVIKQILEEAKEEFTENKYNQ
jgi:hypothetical protein